MNLKIAVRCFEIFDRAFHSNFLSAQVTFWLPSCRHQFYLCLKKQIAEGKFNLTQEKAVQLCALMAQVEYGDLHSNAPRSYPQFLSPWCRDDMERKIAEAHRKLEGMSSSIARDAFLNVMSKEELYDAEIFKAKSGGQKVLVAVGSGGLKVYERRTHGKLKQT